MKMNSCEEDMQIFYPPPSFLYKMATVNVWKDHWFCRAEFLQKGYVGMFVIL